MSAGGQDFSLSMPCILGLNEAHCSIAGTLAVACQLAGICRCLQCALWSHGFGCFAEFHAGHGELPG